MQTNPKPSEIIHVAAFCNSEEIKSFHLNMQRKGSKELLERFSRWAWREGYSVRTAPKKSS